MSAADTTLADGYGHLADRAILFHAMLAAAGFQPEFVLASDLPPVAAIVAMAKHFPLPQNFQYPLVRVMVDGQPYYLNDTDQYSQPGTTAHAGRLGMVLASRSIEEIKPAKNCEDHSDTVYTVMLAKDGQAQIGVTRRYFGNEYNAKNHYFSELPPEERRRYFQEVVSAVAQGARPAGDLATKFDRYPGIEQYSVTVDHFAVVDRNISLISTCPSSPPGSRWGRTRANCRCSSMKPTTTGSARKSPCRPDSKNWSSRRWGKNYRPPTPAPRG